MSPFGAIVLGAIAGSVCSLAIALKNKFGYDDSLDVVGVHLVGGLIGTVLVGLLATDTGLFYGGGFDQLWRQAVGAFSVMAFSFVMSYLIALLVKHTVGWRVSTSEELGGIDLAEHSEAGYDLSPVYYSSRVGHTLVLTKDNYQDYKF